MAAIFMPIRCQTRTHIIRCTSYGSCADFFTAKSCLQGKPSQLMKIEGYCTPRRHISNEQNQPLLHRVQTTAHNQHLTGVQQFHADALPRKSLLEKVKAIVGVRAPLRYSRRFLKKSGLRLYLCAVELVDYDEFFKEFKLPDTFNSWFRITELHMWMCMVRLAPEGRDGTIVRNLMLKNLWEDIEKRTKKLGETASSSARRTGISYLNEEFRASIYSYDEGLLSDDKTLAGTVWRNFFEMQCEDPEQLETMVQYIRKQMWHIESQDSERLLKNGVLTYLPLKGNELNLQRAKPIFNEILNRT